MTNLQRSSALHLEQSTSDGQSTTQPRRRIVNKERESVSMNVSHDEER